MNNRTSIALFLFIFAFTSVATANDMVTRFKCNNISVILYNSNVVESPFFVITVERPGRSKFHTFPVTEEFLDVRCEKDKKGNNFLLVNHFCGGSGCSESNYGLIDLSTGKEVLRALERYRGNSDQAASILGKTIAPFSCKKHSKGSSMPNDKGEFCIVSPLVLN